MAYHTYNLNDEQDELAERVKELLEITKQGPYGGYGGSVSKGEALAYACQTVLPALERHVEELQRRKRAEAAAKRVNNNPGVTPGVSRKDEFKERYSDWSMLPNAKRLRDAVK